MIPGKKIRQATLRIASLTLLLACIFRADLLHTQGTLLTFPREINSPGDEFAPTVTADGATMLFCSKREGKRDYDIYSSTLINGSWSEARPLRDFNSAYNDETPFISASGTTILFASDRPEDEEMSAKAPGDAGLTYDLFISRKKNDRWEAPVRLKGPANSERNERAPALDNDEKTLFFCRWNSRNPELAKLMRARYEEGDSSKVSELPAAINSGNGEIALVPSRVHTGYYFSSQRPGGKGGWDIYFIPFRNGEFGRPVNSGPAVNTDKNEAFMSESRDTLFYSSDRGESIGNNDIFAIGSYRIRATLPAITRLIPGEAVAKKETPVKKEKPAPVKKGAPGAQPGSSIFAPIYFEYKSAIIAGTYQPSLDRIAQFLQDHKDAGLIITGHADLRGSYAVNDRLSLERATAVFRNLTRSGIEEGRLTVRGVGKREPALPGIGEEEDYRNRRVEFELVNAIEDQQRPAQPAK